MKTTLSRTVRVPKIRIIKKLALLFLAFAGATVANAADNTWNVNTAGPNDYTVLGNWLSNTSIPNAAGQTANFTNNITLDQTINLNAATTLGALNIGDASNKFTIAPGTGGSLIFDNGVSNATLTQSAQSNTISAPIALTSSLAITNSASALKLRITGAISGSGGIIANSGIGYIMLNNGGNGFTGGVTINSGGILGSDATSGTGFFGTGTLTINSGGTLMGAGANVLAFSNAMVWGSSIGVKLQGWNLTANGNVNLTSDVTVTNTNSGTSSFIQKGVISGGYGLTKSGANNMKLTGVNTYTGSTAITAGTLFLGDAGGGAGTGSINNSSSIDIQSGAKFDIVGLTATTFSIPVAQTLKGPGTFVATGKTVTVSGTIQPHDTVGGIATLFVSQTTGSLILGNNSTFALNLGATTSDMLSSNGAVSLGLTGTDRITLTINLVAQPLDGTAYTIMTGSALTNNGLFTYAGVGDLANGAIFTVTNNGFSENFQIAYGATSTTLTASAVPEPGTLALCVGGAGMLVVFLRRRRTVG